MPDSREGIIFWQRRLGTNKVNDILDKTKKRDHEVIIELSRAEMRQLLSETENPGMDA